MNAASSSDRDGWEPTGWWRVVLYDGSLWCETSVESEAREAAARAPRTCTIQRHMRRLDERWDDV